jgi:hypothetical protein
METTMSKGYATALALIEAGKQMALGTSKERPMRERKEKEPDVLALLEQKRREYLALKNFVEEQGKLNKPEEKKEEKKWKLEHIAMFLIATSPITGPLYVWWFRSLLGT